MEQELNDEMSGTEQRELQTNEKSSKSLNSCVNTNKASAADHSHRSLSTLGNASYAANSVLTSDDTVIRRGDGAQVKNQALPSPYADNLNMVFGTGQTSGDTADESDHPIEKRLCCCFRRNSWV